MQAPTDALSAVLDVDVAFAFARVERTLLSVAFDVDFDFDSKRPDERKHSLSATIFPISQSV